MKNKRRKDPIITKALLVTDLEIETGHDLPRMNLDASYKSLNKYAKPEMPYDEDARWFAENALEMEFLPHMKDSEVRDLDAGLLDVDLSTSPGFPWNLKYKTKRDLYESADYEFFRAYCDKDWDELTGYKWYVFTNSLKEEIRPDEKIKANKIRTFTASPAEAVVSGNRLFGDMNEKFIASHLKTSSVVGMNPFKGGWNEVYQKLKNHPMRGRSKIVGFEMDESEYDSSLRSFLFEAVCDFRIKCLRVRDRTPENINRIRQYYRNIVNSVIITADGIIIQKHLGNPSGSVNTISDNTLILYFLLAYTWYLLSPVKTIESFRESVVAALQGDDNTWTVDQITAEFYNAVSVSKEFSKIGIVTTSPCYEARELEELSFLSSSFSRFIDHVCVYDLDTDKILESLKWTEYPNDPIRTLERVAACLLNTWPNQDARWLCRKLSDFIINEYDPVLRGNKEWVDQKSKFWTDAMFLFFYVGDAGALNDVSHIKEFNMESFITKNGGYVLEKNKRKKKARGSGVKFASKVVRYQTRKPQRKSKRKNNSGKRRNRKRGAGRMSSRGPMESMVGIATSGISRPGFSIGRSSRGNDSLAVVGHERLGVIQLDSPAIEGEVLFNQLISPELIGARLKGFSKLYDRYCFSRMTFKYVPLISPANAAANGGLVMAIDYDPADPAPAPNRSGLNSAFSSEFAEENAVFSSGIMPAKRINPRKDYYIDDNGLDARWSKQARFYVFAAGAIAAGTYGDLFFEYSVNLFSPQNNPPADEMGGVVVGAGTFAAANILGTTAVVDADSRNISVSSGGVVTFNAAGNVLATVSSTGTTVTAYTVPAGWTATTNFINSAATNTIMVMRKYVEEGETLGPIAMTSAAALTAGAVRIAVAPYNSLSLSSRQQEQLSEVAEFNRLLERLSFVEKYVSKLEEENGDDTLLEESSEDEVPKKMPVIRAKMPRVLSRKNLDKNFASAVDKIEREGVVIKPLSEKTKDWIKIGPNSVGDQSQKG
nr:polyprotein 2 [Patatavirales sp.]